MIFEVFIPLLPPGINETYGYGRGRVYKTKKARDWQESAALIIGSKAAEIDWKDNGKEFHISYILSHSRLDVDGPQKILIDTLAEKLGFNDNRVKKCEGKKENLKEVGVLLTIEEIN